MSAIKLSTPSSGSISLSPANTASNLTITVPAVSGTMLTTASTFAGTGPAFSAYNSTAQSVSSGAFTKCVLNVENFDTNNNFDNTTNYRFTPTVAGYYQISAKLRANGSSSLNRVICSIYKNGQTTGRLFDMTVSFGTSGIFVSGADLLYMNGTTDYIELYAYVEGTGTLLVGGGDLNTTYLYGAMVRAA
jgi:hypothetical protein